MLAVTYDMDRNSSVHVSVERIILEALSHLLFHGLADPYSHVEVITILLEVMIMGELRDILYY